MVLPEEISNLSLDEIIQRENSRLKSYRDPVKTKPEEVMDCTNILPSLMDEDYGPTTSFSSIMNKEKYKRNQFRSPMLSRASSFVSLNNSELFVEENSRASPFTHSMPRNNFRRNNRRNNFSIHRMTDDCSCMRHICPCLRQQNCNFLNQPKRFIRNYGPHRQFFQKYRRNKKKNRRQSMSMDSTSMNNMSAPSYSDIRKNPLDLNVQNEIRCIMLERSSLKRELRDDPPNCIPIVVATRVLCNERFNRYYRPV